MCGEGIGDLQGAGFANDGQGREGDVAPVGDKCPVVDGGGDMLVPGVGVGWGKPKDGGQQEDEGENAGEENGC